MPHRRVENVCRLLTLARAVELDNVLVHVETIENALCALHLSRRCRSDRIPSHSATHSLVWFTLNKQESPVPITSGCVVRKLLCYCSLFSVVCRLWEREREDSRQINEYEWTIKNNFPLEEISSIRLDIQDNNLTVKPQLDRCCVSHNNINNTTHNQSRWKSNSSVSLLITIASKLGLMMMRREREKKI